MKIKKANNLPSSVLDKTDSYVKISINDESKKTKVIDDNINPEFNEELRFNLDNLNASKKIEIQVYDYDTLSDDLLCHRNFMIGNLV